MADGPAQRTQGLAVGCPFPASHAALGTRISGCARGGPVGARIPWAYGGAADCLRCFVWAYAVSCRGNRAFGIHAWASLYSGPYPAAESLASAVCDRCPDCLGRCLSDCAPDRTAWPGSGVIGLGAG